MDPKIKVCGLRDQKNIQEVIALKPDLAGFIFYKGSPRYVGQEFPVHFINDLPDSIEKIGVFVNESSEQILKIADKYGLDYVQLHGEESARDCEDLKNRGIKVIKAIPVSDRKSLDAAKIFDNKVDYLLFDTQGKYRGGNGIPFNWNILKSYALTTPYFISGGLGVEELKQLSNCELPGYAGVDLNSRFEISPGIKNIDSLKEGFEYIR